MKKPFLFAMFVVCVALFVVACASGTTTTTTVAPATTAASPTTTAAPSTTAGSPAGGSTTTSAAAQPGQLGIQLTGSNMAPPVQTSNTATLTFSLQGTSIAYQLVAQGLTTSDVTAAGIFIAAPAGGASTTAAAGGATGQQGEMVIDLLAGQTSGSSTTAATGTGNVIVSGTLTDQNLVGSWAGKSIAEIISLLSQVITTSNGIWAQVNTQKYPNGELRGYIDVSQFIPQLFGGSGPTTTSGTGSGSTTASS